MNIGLAATFCELRNLDPRVLDLEDKQRRVVKNERADLTVMQLLSFIDTPLEHRHRYLAPLASRSCRLRP
jgi:hypothetical protein